MRRISLEEAMQFTLSSSSDLSLLMGDFNAEISEEEFHNVVGNRHDCLDALYHSSGRVDAVKENLEYSSINETLIDLWCYYAKEKKVEHLDDYFTFPSCKPSKRIDYILLHDRFDDWKVARMEYIGKLFKGQQPGIALILTSFRFILVLILAFIYSFFILAYLC